MTAVWEVINLLVLIFFVIVLPVGCIVAFGYVKRMHDRMAEMDAKLTRIEQRLGK